MKHLVFIFLMPLCVWSQPLYELVNPFIGTGGHGHTFPGATAPFGMVQLSPDTRIDGSWDGCSGYHYSDTVIYGFSHTHLSGTGVSDFGDILVMPVMGEPTLDREQYASRFSHDKEKASAGFYSVFLEDDAILAEMTTSTRVGFHKYTFSKEGKANFVIDLNHRDKLLDAQLRVVDAQTVEVLRRSEAWARDQYVYARISFDRPVELTLVDDGKGSMVSGKEFRSTSLAAAFSTNVSKGDIVKIRVALSPTGFDGARRNLGEISHWDFDKALREVQQLWDTELSKIEITTNDLQKRIIFYTALYHTMIQPNIAQDVDGYYRGRDHKIYRAEGFNYYSVFSLWDTFRAAHPLYTLIDKKRTADFITTFIKQYEQGGALPVWELASNETGCMIGYHAVPVIADAMIKGIKEFDYQKAYEAAKHSAMLDHLGLDAYKKQGFIAIDDEHESVSKTLEYAYDDWCIAQMARFLGKSADERLFVERSQYWKNVFDSSTKLMRPRRNGAWDTPFDPREVNNNFTEGNSWQYSFFVPQDVAGLVEAHGSPAEFEAKLDELFSLPSKTTGRKQVDITGLIGQYAHGNEPSHHMAYLYNYIGKPQKTSEKVRYILDNFYTNAPDGLIGNEDCGQMSAWYVLSSMGLYSVTPGQLKWSVTEPYFDAIRVRFEDGSTGFIGKATPKEEREYFGFRQLKGSKSDATPEISEVAVAPVFASPSRSFAGKTLVGLSGQGRIFYRINGDKKFQLYKKPFRIKNSAVIEAYSEYGGAQSKVVAATYIRRPNDFIVKLSQNPNPQYTAGGSDALTDGIAGSTNWRKGDWHGYQSTDFECTVDLRRNRKIQTITAGFLQDTRSWILMPTRVEFYAVDKKGNQQLLTFVDNTVAADNYDLIRKEFHCNVPVKTKQIRVKAYNFGTLPKWHQGAGGDAFIFVDEISVR